MELQNNGPLQIGKNSPSEGNLKGVYVAKE